MDAISVKGQKAGQVVLLHFERDDQGGHWMCVLLNRSDMSCVDAHGANNELPDLKRLIDYTRSNEWINWTFERPLLRVLRDMENAVYSAETRQILMFA